MVIGAIVLFLYTFMGGYFRSARLILFRDA